MSPHIREKRSLAKVEKSVHREDPMLEISKDNNIYFVYLVKDISISHLRPYGKTSTKLDRARGPYVVGQGVS
jgi:hypothetical protein